MADENKVYTVGHITFIVTPVYRDGRGETLQEILLKIMKADISREKIA